MSRRTEKKANSKKTKISQINKKRSITKPLFDWLRITKGLFLSAADNLKHGLFKLKKLNLHMFALVINMGVVSSSISAIAPNSNVITGNSENLSKIIQSVDPYTPLINEKTSDITHTNEVAYIEKPEITTTTTRESIDQAKVQEQKKQLALNKVQRNVIARESTRTQVSTEITQVAQVKSDRVGNSYWYGFCTWYVAEKRNDVPNNWGNAKAWLSSAQKAGWPTGNTPKVGAVLVTSESWAGHVAYVESVDGDNFNISEMNYKGWARTSARTLDINDRVIRGFVY